MPKRWVLFALLSLLSTFLSVSSLSTTTNANVNCKSLWFNRCIRDDDCCSKNCHRDSPRWEFGICKTQTVTQVKSEDQFESAGDSSTSASTSPSTSTIISCKELWFNQCVKDEDCCSENCERGNPFWLYGVCKNKADVRKVETVTVQQSGSKTCQPLWFNECIENGDCCSGNCHRGSSNWLYGVCKEQEREQIESYSEIKTLKTQKGAISKAIHDFRPKNGLHLVSFDEFSRAITSNGFPSPRLDQYQNFIAGLSSINMSGGNSKREVAMMLAQFIHESGGLQFTEEIRCKENPWNCQYDYQESNCDQQGKRYHGRGFIQLTWCH